MNPYCFVITSFGKKDNLKDLQEKFSSKNIAEPIKQINFDTIYEQLVKPALMKAGLEPLIEREETSMGSIHKTMYEKILLCEFCIADITNANPNAYYELGMRYAVKPYSTIPIIASSHFPLPFDIGGNRTFAYSVDKDFNLTNLDNDINALSAILVNAKAKRATDSPLYDMVNGIRFQNAVAHEKTDVFRDQVKYDEDLKSKLAYARSIKNAEGKPDKQQCIDALNKIVEENKPLENVQTAVLIDMMISYRNIEAFTEMQNYIEQLPQYVLNTVMVQEQYAFILNRNGGKKNPVDDVMIEKAIDLLKEFETNSMASSETYGIWGRLLKDKFDRAYKQNNIGEAKAHLKKAMAIYEKGYESDMRDSYPGVNYVTCLELLGENEKALRILPAVEYAVKTKMKKKEPDYWDNATLVELAVIENKYDEAEEFFYETKPLATESWMFGTTKANLTLILNFRKERKEDTTRLEKLIGMFG